MAMGSPLVVEVLAPGLAGVGLGRPVRGLPPGGVGHHPAADEAFRLFRVLDRLREVFDGQVVVHLVEPFSFAWVVRVLRFRPSRYPVFIVGGRRVVVGLDERTLLCTVAACLRAAPDAARAP
jgi:hypothetical protein